MFGGDTPFLTTGLDFWFLTSDSYQMTGVGQVAAVWLIDQSAGRGKSGLQRTRWWITSTVREDRESATENRPPMADPADRHRQG